MEVTGGRSWGWERSRRVCKDLEAIYQVDAYRDMLQRTQNYPRSKKVNFLFQREIGVTGRASGPRPASPGPEASLQRV